VEHQRRKVLHLGLTLDPVDWPCLALTPELSRIAAVGAYCAWVIYICCCCCQVRDTVELFSFRRQRKLSLRYLAWRVLGRAIQDKGCHDSVEDAATALDLYKAYCKYQVWTGWSKCRWRGQWESMDWFIGAFGIRGMWVLTCALCDECANGC
jgi:hypothetical protein